MSARSGRDGRSGYSRGRRIGLAAWLLLGTFAIALPVPAASLTGPRAWAWSAARPAQRFQAAAPRLRATVLPVSRVARVQPRTRPATVTAAVMPSGGGPLAGYYRRALRTQETRVMVPMSLRALQARPDGTLPDWAFVDYLRWRRGQNPARFDRFHPNLGQMLQVDEQIRQAQQTVPPLVRPSAIDPPPLTPPGPVPEPPQVPEPSSMLIALTLISAGWWARRGRRRLSAR